MHTRDVFVLKLSEVQYSQCQSLSLSQHHEHVQPLPMKTEITTTFSLSVLSPLHTAQTQPALLYKADQYADRPTIQRHRTNCRMLKEVNRDTPLSECVQDTAALC